MTPPPHIVLVTGSRKARDVSLLTGALTALYHLHPDAVLYVGDADGADKLAAQAWAHLHVVVGTVSGPDWALIARSGPVRTFDADWPGPCDPATCNPGHRRHRADGTTYCPAAGPRRNEVMCAAAAAAGCPVTTLAVFKSGELNMGTANCVRAMQRHGLPAPITLIEGS
jgi:hypothetical protein